jgi:hypothetical protein
MPDGFNHRAFYSGDVLLSRGLSPYYHWGCSVSLPCSGWERVGPLRYCHQRSEPDWHLNPTGGFAAVAATQAPTRISGDFLGRLKSITPTMNLKEQLVISSPVDPLTSTHREHDSRFETSLQRFSDLTIPRFNKSRNSRASFCFEIFCLFCLPFRETRNGLTEK